MGEKKTVYHGPDLFGLLALLFIGLKLTGHVDWSWWWVLSPIWIPIGLAVVILTIFGIVVLKGDGKWTVKRSKNR